MTIQHIKFEFISPCDGWCDLVITAGNAQHAIRCSQVYDPFQDFADLMLQLCRGHHGTIEIDEEGPVSVIRIDRDPGVFAGRLRIYQPSTIHGSIGEVSIDTEIDIVQFVHAYTEAFNALVAVYDPEEWDPEAPVGRTGSDGRPTIVIPDEDHHDQLSEIDLRAVEAYLRIYGALQNDHYQDSIDIQAKGQYHKDILAAGAMPLVTPNLS